MLVHAFSSSNSLPHNAEETDVLRLRGGYFPPFTWYPVMVCTPKKKAKASPPIQKPLKSADTVIEEVIEESSYLNLPPGHTEASESVDSNFRTPNQPIVSTAKKPDFYIYEDSTKVEPYTHLSRDRGKSSYTTSFEPHSGSTPLANSNYEKSSDFRTPIMKWHVPQDHWIKSGAAFTPPSHQSSRRQQFDIYNDSSSVGGWWRPDSPSHQHTRSPPGTRKPSFKIYEDSPSTRSPSHQHSSPPGSRNPSFKIYEDSPSTGLPSHQHTPPPGLRKPSFKIYEDSPSAGSASHQGSPSFRSSHYQTQVLDDAYNPLPELSHQDRSSELGSPGSRWPDFHSYADSPSSRSSQGRRVPAITVTSPTSPHDYGNLPKQQSPGHLSIANRSRRASPSPHKSQGEGNNVPLHPDDVERMKELLEELKQLEEEAEYIGSLPWLDDFGQMQERRGKFFYKNRKIKRPQVAHNTTI